MQSEQVDYLYYYYPDGSTLIKLPDYPDFKKEGTWNATFDATYKQLTFDKTVGWSRWIELNKQMPCLMSPVDWDPKTFNNIIDHLEE